MNRSIAALVALLTASATLPASGAEYSPQQARIWELNRLVIDSAATFGPDRLIDKVERIETDVYRVTAGECTMIARLEELKGEEATLLGRFVSRQLKMREFVIRKDPIICANKK